MRRLLAFLGLTLLIASFSGPAYAGPGGASGPITVDSTTFVPGSSVMGTDGGVYGDSIPPVTSTTTAAFRMTKYRAQHINLRDNSGVEVGTISNPLNVTGQTTVQLSTVQVVNSTISVTGSTVSINGTVPVSVTGTPTVTIGSAIPAGTNNIGLVSGSSVTIPGTVNTRQVNVSTVIVQSMPALTVSITTVTVTNSSFSIVGISSVNVMNQPTVSIASPLPAGGNQLGLVSGSTVTISNPSVTITGTPNVNVASMPNVVQNNPGLLKASVSISGSSNTVVLGAGSADVGNIAYQLPTISLLNAIVINASTTGDNVIVSTQSSQTVRIFRIYFVVSTPTIITIKSGGSTALSGPMSFLANGSFTLDLDANPWYVTGSGKAFIIYQTGTAQISGTAYYTQS